MKKTNIIKITIIITIAILFLIIAGGLFLYISLSNNTSNQSSEVILSQSSSSQIVSSSSISAAISQNTSRSLSSFSSDQSISSFSQSSSLDTEIIDGGEIVDGDDGTDATDIFNVGKTAVLFNDNGIKVYTSNERRIEGFGWAGNLGINDNIFFVDTHTYIDYEDKTYYIGPSVDYVNLIDDVWYLGIQTDYNEYILYSCDFQCSNQQIIIPDSTKKIVNIEYSDDKNNITLFTIATNDRFAIPFEEDYRF